MESSLVAQTNAITQSLSLFNSLDNSNRLWNSLPEQCRLFYQTLFPSIPELVKLLDNEKILSILHANDISLDLPIWSLYQKLHTIAVNSQNPINFLPEFQDQEITLSLNSSSRSSTSSTSSSGRSIGSSSTGRSSGSSRINRSGVNQADLDELNKSSIVLFNAIADYFYENGYVWHYFGFVDYNSPLLKAKISKLNPSLYATGSLKPYYPICNTRILNGFGWRKSDLVDAIWNSGLLTGPGEISKNNLVKYGLNIMPSYLSEKLKATNCQNQTDTAFCDVNNFNLPTMESSLELVRLPGFTQNATLPTSYYDYIYSRIIGDNG